MRHDVVKTLVSTHIPEGAYAEQWNIQGLHADVMRVFALDLPVTDWAAEEGIAEAEIEARLLEATDRKMAEKTANYTPDVMRMVEKSMLLQILDQIWKEHLLSLDHLRQGIGLRAYAQRDPLNEYKREAFELFEEMLARVRERVTQVLCLVELRFDTEDGKLPTDNPLERPREQPMLESRRDPAFASAEDEPVETGAGPVRSRHAAETVNPVDPTTWGRVPRNAPCPCGSGKKFKHCHGKIT